MKLILKEAFTNKAGVTFPKGTIVGDCDVLINYQNGETFTADIEKIITEQTAEDYYVHRQLCNFKLVNPELFGKLEFILEDGKD